MLRPATIVALCLAALHTADPAHSQATPPDPALADGIWRVLEIDGRPAEHGETIAIGNGRIIARTACNTLSGPISVQDGHLRIGRIAVTLLPCNKDNGAAERRFFAALRAVRGHSSSAGGSVLTGEDRRILVRLAR